MTTAWASTAGAAAAKAANQTSSAAAQSGAKPLEGDDGVCGVCSLSPLALGTRTLGASSPARQTRVVAAPASKQYIAILFCGVLAPPPGPRAPQPFGDVRSQMFFLTRAAFWACYGGNSMQLRRALLLCAFLVPRRSARIALPAVPASTALAKVLASTELAV